MKKNTPKFMSVLIYNDYIKNKILNVGDTLPTVRKLAEKYAPVSTTTIANALKLLEDEGYINKKHGSGCFIADKKENINPEFIGFITPVNLNNGMMSSIYKGINRIAQKENLHVIMSSPTSGEYDLERAEVERMVTLGCKTILLYPNIRTINELKDDYLKTEFREQNIVLIDMGYSEQGRSTVVFDNYSAGYDMTEYLINKGHKNILFTEYNYSYILYRSIDARRDGYFAALNDYGIKGSLDNILKVNYSYIEDVNEHLLKESIRKYLKNWKELNDRPTAIISIHDGVAMIFITVAKEMGIEVHKDLEVVGFDNLAIAQQFTPAITTTNPDFEKAGEIAVKLALKECFEGFTYPQTYVLPAPLLIK